MKKFKLERLEDRIAPSKIYGGSGSGGKSGSGLADSGSGIEVW